MQPLTDLINGLKVLESFLIRYNFGFDNYENGKGSGGQFTNATYISGQKKFVIGYRYSLTQLYYQFANFKVEHSFYLDHLGFADKKQFPDFQSDDKLASFRHVLHDLDFLVDDFFEGSCTKLVKASKLQEIFIKELKQKTQEEYDNNLDKFIIDQARQKFKDKEYKKTLDIYATVVRKNLLSEVDKKTIAYCKRHI